MKKGQDEVALAPGQTVRHLASGRRYVIVQDEDGTLLAVRAIQTPTPPGRYLRKGDRMLLQDAEHVVAETTGEHVISIHCLRVDDLAEWAAVA